MLIKDDNTVVTFGMAKVNYQMKYIVISLWDLLLSHGVTGNPEPRYCVPGMQPRDREATVSNQQIHNLTMNFDALRYCWLSPWLDRGAIIVENNENGRDPIFKPVPYKSDKEVMVISGNGRGMSMVRQATYFPEKWAEFQRVQREVVRLGIIPGVSLADLDKVKDAVLVRVLVNQSEVNLISFAQEANGDDKAGMSLSERSKVYDQYIDDDLLAMLVAGDNLKDMILSGDNNDFLENFYSRMPESDKAEIQGKSGDISDMGLAYLRGTLAFHALKNSPQVDKFLEEMSKLDQDAGSFVNGIINAVVALAKAESLIRNGVLSSDYGIAHSLVRIMSEIIDMKANRTTVKKFLGSVSVLPTLTPNERELVKCFYNQDKGGAYRIKSANQIGELLTDWAAAAIAQTRRGVLPVVPRHQLLAQVFKSDWCQVHFVPETIQPIVKPQAVVVSQPKAQAVAVAKPVIEAKPQAVAVKPQAVVVKPVVIEAKPQPVVVKQAVVPQPVVVEQPQWQWQNEALQTQRLNGETQFRVTFADKGTSERPLFDARLNILKVVVFKATGQNVKWNKLSNAHYVSVELTNEQIKGVMEAVAAVKVGGVKLNHKLSRSNLKL